MRALASSRAASCLLRLRLMLLAALLGLPYVNALAQAKNTSYTSDMPSVERVKAEIKGSDPTDTLARQVAVFTYLSAYIQRIKYNRTYSGPYTPDEQRLIGAYDLAAYQISQGYAKSHTPDEAKAMAEAGADVVPSSRRIEQVAEFLSARAGPMLSAWAPNGSSR